MLDFDTDRLDFSDLLAPPEGYEMEFGVLASYSLDLDALALACMSLNMSIPINREDRNNVACLVDSIVRMEDKLVVFVDRGSISSGTRNHSERKMDCASAFLEPIVKEVTAGEKKDRQYPSFHPKVWALKFSDRNDPGRKHYRLVIGSRNLTFSTDQDVCIALESVDGGDGGSDLGDELPEFLRSLRYSRDDGIGISEKQRTGIEHLADELGKVRFMAPVVPNAAIDPESLRFHCSWPGKRETFERGLLIPEAACGRMLVISPFLSEGQAEAMGHCAKSARNGGEGRFELVTRRDSYTQEVAERLGDFTVYGLNESIADSYEMVASEQDVAAGREGRQDDEPSRHLPQTDIHAKVYCYTADGTDHLLVGSPNATFKGFCRNTEAVLEMRGKGIYTALRQSLLEWEEDEEALFVPVKPVGEDLQEPDRGKDWELRAAIKDMFAPQAHGNPPEGEIRAEQDGSSYTTILHLPAIDGSEAFELAPRTMSYGSSWKPYEKRVEFSHMEPQNLTQWFTLRRKDDGSSKTFLVPIPQLQDAEDAHASARANGIRRQIADDVAAYLEMLLSDNPEATYLESREQKRRLTGGGSRKGAVTTSNLYERLMRLVIDEEGRKTIAEAQKSSTSLIGETGPYDAEDLEGVKELLETFSAAIELYEEGA